MRMNKNNGLRPEADKKSANQFKMIEFTETAKEKVNRHIKISTFFLTIILIYIIFLTYQYLSIKPTKSVIVESGVLEESGTFEAMVIRSEKNVYAQESGVLDIFLPAGTTAKRGETVCSISRDINKRNQILDSLSTEKARLTSTIDFDEQTQKKFQALFREYAVNINYHNFNLTNQVVLELNNMLNSGAFGYTIQDLHNYQKVMDNLDLYRQQIESIGHKYTVEKSSTIYYSCDGLEDISAESFQPHDLNRKPQFLNRLESQEVKANDFLFKKIDNLYCHFAVEVDAIAYNYLEKSLNSYVDLFFPSKNLNMTVRLNRLEPYESKYIAVFMADRFINRFLEDRFLPIEISYNQYNGLKIPNSSITSKVTWVIPKTAIAIDEKGDYYVRKKIIDEKQRESAIPIRVKVYGETKEEYFILPVDDIDDLLKEDVILNLNSQTNQFQMYVIAQEEKLYGVYVLNKGYTDFKRIRILYQSDNFSIVQKYFSYSIKIYDQIASEANVIKEFAIVK
ncbi:hypothetical protein EII17_06195 [Clostridiales bacterium COT073_COT-073]|nr:hypothetical protein EII17_06195 [Clostridiales bacterium COT073_COT-073]